MPRCAAIGCNNNGNHSFPKNSQRRKLWEKALRIRNFKATDNFEVMFGTFYWIWLWRRQFCYRFVNSNKFITYELIGIQQHYFLYKYSSLLNRYMVTRLLFYWTSVLFIIYNSLFSGLTQVHTYLKKTTIPTVFSWKKSISSATIAREQRYLKRSSKKELFPSTSQETVQVNVLPVLPEEIVDVTQVPNYQNEVEVTTIASSVSSILPSVHNTVNLISRLQNYLASVQQQWETFLWLGLILYMSSIHLFNSFIHLFNIS